MIDKIGAPQVESLAKAPPHAGEKKAEKASRPAEPHDRVSIGKRDDTPEAKKKWTVLFYFDGNNNLAPMAKHSFSALRKVGSDKNVNLVGQFSVPKEEARRGLITDAKSKKTFFPGSEKIGITDMGDPKTLQTFLEWGIKKYPADHVAVVVWDHGAGFMGSMTDDKSHHIIDNAELATAMKNVAKEAGQKIDVLNFNACVMGQAEVGYELRDAAKYMVGSEETEAGLILPIPGVYGTTPQHKVMTDLKKGIEEKGDITPEELSKLYVFDTGKQFGATMFSPTQSAIDLSKMAPIKDGADKVASLLLDAIKADPKALDIVRDDFKKTQHFLDMDMFVEPYEDFRDLGHFAKVIGADQRLSPAIRNAAAELGKAVKDSVVAEFHVLENSKGHIMAHSTGLTAYMPTDYGFDKPRPNPIDNIPSGATHGYERMEFAQKTKWDELLTTVAKDDDFLGKHPKIRTAVEKALPMIENEGYNQAWQVLGGSTKPGWTIIPGVWKLPFLPVPGPVAAVGGAIGGITRAAHGVKKAVTGIVEDFKPKVKAKLTANGVIDTVIGAGAIATSIGLLVGATAVAMPAALVVMGLGVGRMATNLISGALKTHKANQMTVQEKLAATDQSMKKNGTIEG